jgi:hypothetical protein
MRTATVSGLLCLLIALTSAPAGAQGRSPSTGENVPSLTAKLDALQARVAKLEGGQVTASDLAGTYGVYLLGTELRAFPSRISSETVTGTLTLNADGTGSVTVTDKMFLLTVGGALTTPGPQAGADTFTWTTDGHTVSSAIFDFLPLTIGAGGRLLIYLQGPGNAGPNGSWTNFILLVKLP